MKKEKTFLFNSTKLDDVTLGLTLSDSGKKIADILDDEKYYYCINFGESRYLPKIGINYNLNGKYAINVYNTFDLNQTPYNKFQDMCNVKWFIFVSKKTMSSYVNSVVDRFLLVSNFS